MDTQSRTCRTPRVTRGLVQGLKAPFVDTEKWEGHLVSYISFLFYRKSRTRQCRMEVGEYEMLLSNEVFSPPRLIGPIAWLTDTRAARICNGVDHGAWSVQRLAYSILRRQCPQHRWFGVSDQADIRSSAFPIIFPLSHIQVHRIYLDKYMASSTI